MKLPFQAPFPLRSVLGPADNDVSDLTQFVTKSNERLSASGGFGDIWVGLLETGSIFGPYKVAIKFIRLHHNTDADREKMEMRLMREIAIWKRLEHPNIVHFLGTIRDSTIGMVAPWMGKGNLHDHLRTECLTDMDKLRLPHEIASGLSYLHSKGVIHGDLSSGNVLVRDDGTACLSDFGLSHLKTDSQGTSYMTMTIGGALRWRAPELVPHQDTDLYEKFLPILTFKCDIYSMATVVLEVSLTQRQMSTKDVF
ncbi:hypothetical protein HWV62_14220 [Athelia sp. TMB]|nr:hypothetical protein HWV62_14220 [Athelia sp. TMB]